MKCVAVTSLLLAAVLSLGGFPFAGVAPCSAEECDCVQPWGGGRACESGGACDPGCVLGCCASLTFEISASKATTPEDLPVLSPLLSLPAPPSPPHFEIQHVPKAA
jgi:hypothetical protein